MEKKFNTTGACIPKYHYMVNLDSRLEAIRKMVDSEQYFCINKGRQYGKTTILKALKKYLSSEYTVVSMDFQKQMSNSSFADEERFVKTFGKAFSEIFENCQKSEDVGKTECDFDGISDMVELFKKLSQICKNSEVPVVLIIDEVDQASNNQVFLDFLAQLRGYYLDREETATFQSVILAGVHDIRNLRQKIRPDAEHKHNSPWNIASAFEVEMSFSPEDIATMLSEYEKDNNTGMDIEKISQLIYDYTSGYPVLVSNMCAIMDKKSDWTKQGVLYANREILIQKNPLFESLINKLEDNEQLCELIYGILFNGYRVPYNPDDSAIDSAMMYGFVKNENGFVAVANRIFEVRIYNWFVTREKTQSPIFVKGMNEKTQFVVGNHLDMEKILERFVVHYNDIYGSQTDKFKEEDGRKLFLLYLRPIINGVGNYYIEAQTRDHRRTDIVVDYCGEQYIIELKIWYGDEYNTKGEQQLSEYLESYHLDKGYLVTFSFLKNKNTGVKTIECNGKIIVEATV